MVRTTVDYGIDLGTTTSCIAKLDGRNTVVIPNEEGMNYTPSAVYMDKKGRLYVGRFAKRHLVSDGENAFSKFKLGMGKPDIRIFKNSSKQMNPEELSAEVLKSLRRNVIERYNEDINAVVITVPADFDLPENDATKRAAEYAGFRYSPLIMEPVAAALAYGYQSEEKDVMWMIYDFGGGTFDAAIVKVDEDEVVNVNHAGDKYLGGELIDWDIVDKIFVPKIKSEYNISDFDRRDKVKWGKASAKLKRCAEWAKVQLSKVEDVDLEIENLLLDNNGQWIDFEYTLTRTELKEIMDPYIERSLNHCQRAMTEKGLDTSNIQKIILVGGQSLSPIIQGELEKKFNIPLEFSIDPVTVVARGAAIYAGSEINPIDDGDDLDVYSVNLKYEPIGTDSNPFITGKVKHPEGKSLSGFRIEFIESKTQWRSGKIDLSDEGIFSTELYAENKENNYTIELTDNTGSILDISPNTLPYTKGKPAGSLMLTHSIGLGLADNSLFILAKKGEELPVSNTEVFHTTKGIQSGNSQDKIRIPIFEGENLRKADRNTLIGTMLIKGEDINRSLPEKTEVEVTLDIDKSRTPVTNVYVPSIDYESSKAMKIGDVEVLTPSELEDDFKREKERLEEIKNDVTKVQNNKANEALTKIRNEKIIENIDGLLVNCRQDKDARDKCRKRIIDLKNAIDNVEEALELPKLIQEVNEIKKAVCDIVYSEGTSAEKSQHDQLEQELRDVIRSEDINSIKLKKEQMARLGSQIIARKDGTIVIWFYQLAEERNNFTDPMRGDELIERGRRAIDQNDVNELRNVVSQLAKLLRVPPPLPTGGPGDLRK